MLILGWFSLELNLIDLLYTEMNKQTLSQGSENKETMVLHCAGMELDLRNPVVMGILNITPDSFYDGGSFLSSDNQVRQTEKMLTEGASIIDIGAVSTRPGADAISCDEELKRLIPALQELKKRFPGKIFSVDTSRGEVARAAIDHGAGMINDIYGGRYDNEIVKVVTAAKIPFVIMHMQGTPSTMQLNPAYNDVVEEVRDFFMQQTGLFPQKYSQLILDPGFGFGKSLHHNYQLLSSLETFKSFGLPLMTGISRKSIINQVLKTKPSEALNGTSVLNTIALMKGADILRVHDVKEAMEALKLVGEMIR